MKQDWATKAVKEVMDGHDWNGKRRLSTAALGALCTNLVRRAVGRERASWRRKIKKLRADHQKVIRILGKETPLNMRARESSVGGIEALDDLLSRPNQEKSEKYRILRSSGCWS